MGKSKLNINPCVFEGRGEKERERHTEIIMNLKKREVTHN